MDKEKLFKDNILLINENYKLNNQLNIINNSLKSVGITRENLREIIEKIKVRFYIIYFSMLKMRSKLKMKQSKD